MLRLCNHFDNLREMVSDPERDDEEVPVASFVTQNFSYQLLGFIPLASGVPWTEGDEDVCDKFSVSLFSDKATIDNNLVSLRHALDRVGSHRVTQLRSYEKDDCDWSLYLINRHEARTSCIILKDKE